MGYRYNADEKTAQENLFYLTSQKRLSDFQREKTLKKNRDLESGQYQTATGLRRIL